MQDSLLCKICKFQYQLDQGKHQIYKLCIGQYQHLYISHSQNDIFLVHYFQGNTHQ